MKTDYVESIVANSTVTGTDVSVGAYTAIELKSEEVGVNQWEETEIKSLVYDVKPKVEVKGEDGRTEVYEVSDVHLDGAKITLSLFVGDMNPKQIIHHKNDGTKEYF